MDTNNKGQEPIAIIGIALRVPDADNPQTFWENLASARDSVKHYSREELEKAGVPIALLDNPAYVRARGSIENLEYFDARFFGYAPHEAALIDPQQRILLECAWEALEDAGYDPGNMTDVTGVYAGAGISRYLLNKEIFSETRLSERYLTDISNGTDYLSSRIAYKLNLKGPAITIQTACSTSLVAIHQACQAIYGGDCDIALAGGVSLGKLEKGGHLYQQGMIYSPDGKCRAFDAAANGIVRGQGAGIVVLKKYTAALRANDHIYSLILSSAINNDGADKMGFTAPSAEGQAKAIRQAHQKAGISSENISYVETHGTGTLLGDPVEIEGLTQAFSTTTDKKQFCAIGSVKTNIGHLDAAAGIAGLIKTALSLHHRKLLPSLHFEQPNPYINFADSPFFVNTQTVPWEQNTRRAGVSSFGIGGTNAHVILEEAPQQPASTHHHSWQLIPLSAASPVALQDMAIRLEEYVQRHPELSLPDIACTLQVGRRAFPYRYTMVCRNTQEMRTTLQQLPHDINQPVLEEAPPVVFMFQGQGSLYPGLGRELYLTLPVFKAEVDRCMAIAEKLFPKRFQHLTPDKLLDWENTTAGGEVSQPALFILQYALAQYLISLGIKPSALMGYSSGEYVAACLAGVFTLEDALALVSIRWQLVRQTAPGKMIAVRLGEAAISNYIREYQLPLDIAGITGPDGCVISGTPEAIQTLADILAERNLKSYYLPIDRAYHSRLLNPILEVLAAKLATINIQPPTCPLISNVSGSWMDPAEVVTPSYWVKHLRHTVRFSDALSCVAENGQMKAAVFLEVGPGQVLSNLAMAHPAIKQTQKIHFTMGASSKEQTPSEVAGLFSTVGELWQYGIPLNWQLFGKKEAGRRISLPTYPFERIRHWITVENTTLTTSNTNSTPQVTAYQKAENVTAGDELLKLVTSTWQQILGLQEAPEKDSNFFKLGGDSLIGVQILSSLSQQLSLSLNPSLLVKYPEPGKLATYLGQAVKQQGIKSEQPQTENIIHILNKGRQDIHPPLVLIHPIGGELYIYRDLITALGKDQPIVAIASPLLKGPYFRDNSIPTMAATYLAMLADAGLSSSFVLCGSSFGGVIAYEMSYQLRQRGTPAPLVVMIDAPAVPVTYSLNTAQIIQILLRDKLTLNIDELQAAGGISEQIAYVKTLIEKMGTPHLLSANFQSAIETYDTNWQALRNYQPVPGNEHILFFHPREAAPGTPLGWQLFWQQLQTGHHFEVFPVPGTHITMNYYPHVNNIAAPLEQALFNLMKP